MPKLNERCVRTIFSTAILAALMSMLTGCMTTTLAVNRAGGYDTLPPRDPKLRDARQPRLKPNPAYYALLPLTVPIDIATLPIQIPVSLHYGSDHRFILSALNDL